MPPPKKTPAAHAQICPNCLGFCEVEHFCIALTIEALFEIQFKHFCDSLLGAFDTLFPQPLLLFLQMPPQSLLLPSIGFWAMPPLHLLSGVGAPLWWLPCC